MRLGPGDNNSPSETADDEAGTPDPWAGIPDVQPHPHRDARRGEKQQGYKEGGADQAREDFDEATQGQHEDLGDGRLLGEGPNGENLVYNPSSGRGANLAKEGFPTIYVDGNPIRYDL